MIVVVGESASGKTSVVRCLVNKYGFENIITYTTRPQRKDEQNGVDYHFIVKSQFEKLKEQDFFAETAEYNGWYYGSAKEDYNKCSNKKVVILTPAGVRQLRNNKINAAVVYLNVPRRDRLIKILKRGDNIEESYRRNLSDVGQFDGFVNEADIVIKNKKYKKSVDKVSKEIYKKYKEKLGE